MNELVLARSDVKVMLWHLALYGLAAILEDSDARDIRLAWGRGMQPRARLTTTGLNADQIGAAVREHAYGHSIEPSWVMTDVVLRGSSRGLMSPRITPFENDDVRLDVQQQRHAALDRATDQHDWLDLMFLAALGEPSYWSRNAKDEPLQDDGASRLEMQPRNQGSEFVATKLRKLAVAVAGWDAQTVTEGLTGKRVRDVIGKDSPSSRTPTGFSSPGPTDNAVAWCAMWGISQLPLAAQVNRTSLTSGHIGKVHSEWFYLPVWRDEWRPARLRTILASQQLKVAASENLPSPWSVGDAKILAARSWSASRGVEGIVRFPIERFGSDSAPERRSMLGALLRTHS